ncbi:hypothetical protein AB205_0221700 [Aquarana catesbeiana]|uniref:Uncharacterized protein n=1 Tax=Aquarana catesbeiana TaxID=8400 RepID=A0A2G9RWJ9_AQUCT|nr:hypothetical protein AB205_0221700 [Aquarana catesbeiana]
MFHIPISGLKYLCAKYTFCFFLIGEKRLGGHHSEDTRKPTPQKEGELSTTPHPEDLEDGEVEEVGELVTTTGVTSPHLMKAISTHFGHTNI